MPELQPDSLAAQARGLCREYRHAEAEQLLTDALAEEPKNPDLWAELGIIYCLTQREPQAVELLGKAWGGEREGQLAQILADHFECRRLVASRLGIKDELGKSLAKTVRTQTGKRPGTVGIRLSACLIVKDEERHLARCLESIKDVADEIIVIDTGSTDRTVAIAEQYGAVVDHFTWCDDFSAARNESLKYASGDWVLWIDADEELTDRSKTAIREGLMRPQFGGFYIKIVNFMSDTGEAAQYIHSPVRLFKRHPEILFEGTIHEQITPSIHRLGLQCATLENATLHHYGYRPSEMEAKNKVERTISMLEEQVASQPDEAFHWFNLANAHVVGHQYEQAAEAAIECIERLTPENAYASLTYQLLQTALIELGRADEAISRFEEAERKGLGSILTEFERAHALSRLGRYDEALASIQKCFDMEWPSGLTGDYGIITFKRHLLRGQIYAQMGRLDEAIADLEHVLAVDVGNPRAHFALGKVLDKRDDYEGALRHLECAMASPSYTWAARKAASKILLSLARFKEAHEMARAAWDERPGDIEIWNTWTDSAEAMGDFESANQAYVALLEQHDATLEVLVNYGRMLVRAGDAEGALSCFAEALRLAPTDANALFNTGDLLYSLGQFEEAANAYQAGLQVRPDFAQGWFVLGNSLVQMNVFDGAEIAFAKALELDPEHQAAAHNLQLVSGTQSAA
jgi:tetratricopeptide (TPR) repeat protein